MEKDTNVALLSFLRLFTEKLLPKEKAFFQNYMRDIVKIDKIAEELWHNRNLSFRNFLLRSTYSTWSLSRIRNFMIKNKKYTQVSFVFTF